MPVIIKTYRAACHHIGADQSENRPALQGRFQMRYIQQQNLLRAQLNICKLQQLNLHSMNCRMSSGIGRLCRIRIDIFDRCLLYIVKKIFAEMSLTDHASYRSAIK